ncbi:MAG: DUF1653 domain-containing protein [Trichocoleus desertorum ATA4-8-CV12]|jgi:hypothetical protein|nr:DUF1653 domain-containing protein [Trichocoleus desertorum ATA4-8-CV12]
MSNVKLGRYEHFKGKTYEVMGVGKHSETEEELVIYRRVGDDQLWLRPVSMFQEHVQHEGRSVPRFEYVENRMQGRFEREN